MARNVRWTHRALIRLDEIAGYIGRDNPTRAKSFVTELRDKVALLKSRDIGKPGRVVGTKELVLHNHYVAVYRVKGDEVHIVTILHTAQNSKPQS